MISYSDIPSEIIESQFPRLNSAAKYELRSPEDENYNCIAYAAGDTGRWWWPVQSKGATYWPQDVSREHALSAFVSAFESVGYELCPDGEPEERFEKIALFADGDKPTHAARYEASTDMWLSKLGKWIDIAHRNVEDVGGGVYGEPVCYLRRPAVKSSLRENVGGGVLEYP